MRYLFIILLLWLGSANAQKGEIVGEASFPQKNIGKPMVLLLYANWCGICVQQKRHLKTAQEGIKGVDWVILNPETYKKDINFLGKKYQYTSNGTSGLHRLAYELAGQRSPNYPFWVLVDEESKISTHEGFLKTEELIKLFKK